MPNRKALSALIAAPLLGVAATLAFEPAGWVPLLPLALAALFALAGTAPPRRALLLGWLFGVGHFLSGVYWVYVSTHVYGGAPWWLSAVMAALLVAYLALFPAMALWLASVLGGTTGWAGVVVLPAAWLLTELLRGWLLTGFPWLSLGYVATGTPLATWAPLIGVHGISALLVAMAYALSRLGLRRRVDLQALGWVVLALAPLAIGRALPAASAWTDEAGVPRSVAIVQGNVPQDQKWLPDQRWPTLDRYLRMTEAALGADLVVWPEVAVTLTYQTIHEPYLTALAQQARQAGSTVLAGLIFRSDGGGYQNGIDVLGVHDGRYLKRHLVPFGEYFPIPDFMRPVMDLLGTPYDDIQSGADEQAAVIVDGNRLGLSICFEDVFGREVRREAADQAYLVNLTNDAWFAGTSAPRQHLQIARLRALETGRELVRAANTGVSALIDADGRLRAHSAWGRTEILKTSVRPRTGTTPYVRWGDWPLGLLALLVVAVALGRRRLAG
ncbi:MAG: apolipoprotein N-acyltransferase [Nevskiales bacterium]|nr:apolipoprotein N-acyltransferase [Nevskiales bacterium]